MIGRLVCRSVTVPHAPVGGHHGVHLGAGAGIDDLTGDRLRDVAGVAEGERVGARGDVGELYVPSAGGGRAGDPATVAGDRDPLERVLFESVTVPLNPPSCVSAMFSFVGLPEETSTLLIVEVT